MLCKSNPGDLLHAAFSSNKQRLYVALYARGGKPKMAGLEDTYHWGFILGPKIEHNDSQVTRYHASETMTEDATTWIFDERLLPADPVQMLLVRVMIGKVANFDRFNHVMRNTPIRADQEGWNCVGWIKEALQGLQVDEKSMRKCVYDWQMIRDVAMEYCQKKRNDHRFDGTNPSFNMKRAPTYDLLQGRETQI